MENKFGRPFSHYEKEVIQTFRNLKREGKLPSELERPSPAKLRDYCLWILVNRYDRKYDEGLRKFFDPENKYQGDHENSIRKVDVERLRPLINFLNEKTQKTDENNIKLLAWLIDCKPYEVWKEETATSIRRADDSERKEETGPRWEQAKSTDTPAPPPLTPVPNNPSWLIQTLKKPAFYIFIVVLCGGGYLLVDAFTPRCMYWDTDRYVLISCRKAGTIGVDTLVIPRDPDKEKLRRIMLPDTLTKSALGRAWYAKITVDSIEFFNHAGFHPVYTDKKLRPVTAYILKKYVREK